MPYTVYFMDPMQDDGSIPIGRHTQFTDDVESWKEKNKDEVIDRLIWLLRRMEWAVVVEYPDGERY